MLTALRYLVLGYDLDEADARALPRALTAARTALPGDDPDVLAGELAIMRIFADLSALSRNRRGPRSDGPPRFDGAPEADSAETAHNPQEYLYAFLRSRDADAEGLPESFRARLRAALAHYGVSGPRRTRRRGAGRARSTGCSSPTAGRPRTCRCCWTCCSGGSPTPPASPTLPPATREEYLRTLEHLITATQVRHPVVGDLARQVRFRSFDEPLIDAARARGQEQVRAELDRLDGAPTRPRAPR